MNLIIQPPLHFTTTITTTIAAPPCRGLRTMGVPHDNRAAPAPPDAAELFRRHFESRFAPLQLPSGAPPPPRRSPGLGQQHDPPRADPDADEEWLGFEDELEPGRTSGRPSAALCVPDLSPG